jgi:RNA polymerase sigma-70 factor (ECF subfamily)
MAESFETDLLAILPKLRATAVMFTRDRSAADDLLQDSIVLALQAQASFTPGTNLSAWMYRLMRNRFISLLRRRRLATVSLDDPAALAVGAWGDQEDHIAQLELEQALQTLPVAQREALMLVGAAGHSYEEAAEALDCSVGTVKSRVSRARLALRQQLLGTDPGTREPEDGPDHMDPTIKREDSPREKEGEIRAKQESAPQTSVTQA